MSLVYNDTSTHRGIIQAIERNLGFSPGDISGNSTRLAQFTADINLALDRVFSLIFSVGGTWQFDDSNHEDYPEITTNLISGRRDYTFTEDGSGNLILEIHKVWVADEQGLFREVSPVDVPSGAPANYWDGLNTTGQPNTYDKKANGILLDPPTDYDEPNGLKIQISREGSYFTTSDTDKKPGFAGLYHEYLALRPAYQYAYRKGLANVQALQNEMIIMEDAIQQHYKSREKDVQKTLRARSNNSR